MFPYPSGKLHMGHLRNYTISDLVAKYHILKGFDVLHPIGWDAFGLPAENAALERGLDPKNWTETNIAQMSHVFRHIGIGFDWEAELKTCDPAYFKWTQYLFLKLVEHKLAYQQEAYVNYDPVDKTTLANEQVGADGRSWRSGAQVVKLLKKQWYFKITAYAEELYDETKFLDWPAAIKNKQLGWISKDKKYIVQLPLVSQDNRDLDRLLDIYTNDFTDLAQAAFIAVHPEHAFATRLPLPESTRDATNAYIQASLLPNSAQPKPDDQIQGVHTELYIRESSQNRCIPLVLSTYVNFGKDYGVRLALPGHYDKDARLADFLDIPFTKLAYEPTTASLVSERAASEIKLGKATKEYYDAHKSSFNTRFESVFSLKDWSVSRERYWGTPIPMIECDHCGSVPMPYESLPAMPILPDKSNLVTKCPKCHGKAKRDVRTLDTFVDSSWYFLRFIDVHNKQCLLAKEKAHLMPVDIYIGGDEHALLHLLYARFITKFLCDAESYQIPDREPFTKLLSQGMVHGESSFDPITGKYYHASQTDIDSATGNVFLKSDPSIILTKRFEKMSKSKHNGIDPEDIVDRYGIDVTRAHMIFACIPSAVLEWTENRISGPLRWITKIKTLSDHLIMRLERETEEALNAPPKARSPEVVAIEEKLLKNKKKQLRSIENSMASFSLNGIVSCMMILTSDLDKAKDTVSLEFYHAYFKDLLIVMYPLCPSITSGLYHELYNSTIEQTGIWPEFN